MRKLIVCLSALLSIVFQACKENTPAQRDVIGSWSSPEGARFELKQDNTFVADSIPSKFGFIQSDSIRGRKFSGSGKWTLKKGQTHWEVNVDFDRATMGKNGCAFPIFLSDEGKDQAGAVNWKLFLWQEEEGGARFEFTRK